MNKYAIEVQNLNLTYSFMNSMNIKSEILKMVQGRREHRKKEVHALRDVSFKIERGEVIGVIGGNGAGKSTLLKVLANIYDPDSGTVKVNDNSVFLMSLGAGFQHELPALDNIYLNGLLLGLTRKEVEDKINEIVEFSGIGECINNPLKSFSTGMKSRLAFSIACNIKPNILLIDEILGVGDEEFKVKSREKIRELILEDRTVVLVSHNLNTINELCHKVLWLQNGEVMSIGESSNVISEYKAFVNKNKENMA
ncbi:ABC transporter ATP-binding protein [Oceanirhabdus seepicola]|uniref:ABC transporter ATP-binding protein n=1 Tax=Oceanirhabdus seepicola TaxID=2828781 RepID=A0A9J6P629_9CLOT|nr:ABC transporter ATP-binding protein [Oceanirhabdus seepicola]MCM1991569.1 ABC transporter ATP-binding protein [Oceanirhabdus seepicola]